MSNETFNYSFNITGNAESVAAKVADGISVMNGGIKNSLGLFDSLGGKIVVFNQLSQYMESLSRTMNDTFAPGAALNASIADLSAISGETGESLQTIERYARDAAKTFGGTAAQSVESYKLLLSQLSPELAKTPEALKAMGDNIAILSKTMGGDATAAAEVLTTAMNQYGISLDDPMEASRKMAEMMNVMAAAGKEGSAELPTIKVALEQCGMAAKAAGVSFEETNAAIQVLDKAGKKGAEGGVALRNVMSILATGRFLPKDVREELIAAGVNINDLADKSKSLTERLTPLKSVMNDSALFTKLFGRENSNAAMALVQGIDEVNRCTEAIEGTNTAFDQAAVIMDTYNERKARVQARFDDLRISIFNATGDLGIWVQTITDSVVPLAQVLPLITGLGSGIKKLVTIASVGFGSFKTIAISACRSVGIAIMNIPIVGWIAAAIAGLIALGTYFWNTSAKFRAVLKGLWGAFKAVFTGMWEEAKSTFGAIGDLLLACFRLDGQGIKDALNKMTGGIRDYGANIGKAFREGYDAEMERSKQEQQMEEAGATGVISDSTGSTSVIPVGTGKTNPISAGISGIGGTADKADKIKNIIVTIDKLIDRFEIHTTNLPGDMSKVKAMVAQALTGAVNDVNYAM